MAPEAELGGVAWDGCTNPSVDSAPHRFTCQTCPCLTCQLARAAPLASSFTAVLSLTPKPTCHRGIEALQEDACATLPVSLGPQSVTCHSASLTSICPFLHRSSKRCPPVCATALPPTSREHQEGFGSQGGHSILSPPSTGDASPGWPRPPTSQHVPRQSPPKPVSEILNQTAESAMRTASKHFQPPWAAHTHFPAMDGSSQMRSIPSLK